jgi:hypothetical protein
LIRALARAATRWQSGNPLGFLKSITRAEGTVMSISAGNAND